MEKSEVKWVIGACLLWLLIGLLVGREYGISTQKEELCYQIEKITVDLKGMYSITKENMTCDDFSGAELISIQTFNETNCRKLGNMYAYNTKGFCNIPIKMDWTINKEYCNLQIGDNVYIYR